MSLKFGMVAIGMALALGIASSAQEPSQASLRAERADNYYAAGNRIDIAAPEGTEVSAAADGTVIYAGEQPAYGAVVILRHEDGLVTLYAHNSAVLVREGARVARGEPIARVGQTGRTTGPHLHFEVRQGTRPRNPLLFLP